MSSLSFNFFDILNPLIYEHLSLIFSIPVDNFLITTTLFGYRITFINGINSQS